MMDAMHALGQRLELSSFLILPIQRLTKYGLLLGDILKYIKRLDRKSLPLETAAAMLLDTSSRANNSVHYFELEGLAKKDIPLCELDLQDLFWVKCDGVWKERRVFLFKSAVVLTKPLAHEGMGQSLVIQKVVDVRIYVYVCVRVGLCVCGWVGVLVCGWVCLGAGVQGFVHSTVLPSSLQFANLQLCSLPVSQWLTTIWRSPPPPWCSLTSRRGQR